MTSTVVKYDVDVNQETGDPSDPRDTSLVVSLEERLKFAIQRSGVSARALALKAGLSHGYFPSIFRALKEDPEASTETGSLRRIASASGVSFAWLVSGAGTPDDAEPPPRPTWRPAFGQMENWPELLARAKEIEPDVAAWAWERLAELQPQLEADPTPVMVAELAKWVQRHERLMRPPVKG